MLGERYAYLARKLTADAIVVAVIPLRPVSTHIVIVAIIAVVAQWHFATAVITNYAVAECGVEAARLDAFGCGDKPLHPRTCLRHFTTTSFAVSI